MLQITLLQFLAYALYTCEIFREKRIIDYGHQSY